MKEFNKRKVTKKEALEVIEKMGKGKETVQDMQTFFDYCLQTGIIQTFSMPIPCVRPQSTTEDNKEIGYDK